MIRSPVPDDNEERMSYHPAEGGGGEGEVGEEVQDLSLVSDVENPVVSTTSDGSGLVIARLVTGEPSRRALPRAEEVINTLESGEQQRRNVERRSLMKMLGMAIILLYIIVIGIVLLAVFLPSNDDDDDDASPLSCPNMTMTNDSTADISPSNYIFSLLPRNTIIAINGTSADSESPQVRAYHWLLHDPTFLWKTSYYSEWRTQQRFVLATFYFATGGDETWSDNSNWLSYNVSECLWFFQFDPSFFNYDKLVQITTPCGMDGNGRYQNLILYENGLRGELPPKLSLLSSLQLINLTANSLEGNIPGHLSSLETLDLTANKYASIPSSIGELSCLTDLRLIGNDLVGQIPTEIALMTSIQGLYLDTNQLNGPLPSEFGLLLSSSLKTLYLFDNNLTISIPTEWGQMKALEELRLGNNCFPGQIIPTEFGLLQAVTSLDVLDYSEELTEVTKYTYLLQAEVTWQGTIPSEIGMMVSMHRLNLVSNGDLVGPIPSEIGNMNSCTSLYLSNNHLTGFIPSQIGTMSKLFDLVLGFNTLIGPIPSEIGALSDLRTMYLNENILGGSIPAAIMSLSRLRSLYANKNSISGSIPS
jgi:hypothetical protein